MQTLTHPRHRPGPPTSPTAPTAGSEAPRERSVWRTLAVGGLALLLAALLDAETLDATASSQPFGWRRDLATAVTGPLLTVSEAVGLTWPRHALEELLDRPSTHHAGGSGTFPTTTTATPTTAPGSSTSSTTTTQPTTSTSAPHRRPTAADPLRVWIAGDSMTEALGPILVDDAEATGVIAAHHLLTYSSGLTRPDFFDWYAVSTAELAASDPEVVIVMFGANDAQGIQTAAGPAAFGTTAWIAEYQSRVGALMDLLASDGRSVYWVGQPIMRSSAFSERMALLDRIYRAEAERRPGQVTFVDTWSLMADAGGSYSAYLPGAGGEPVLVRRSDGIHLTPAGAAIVAHAVLGAVDGDLDIEELVP